MKIWRHELRQSKISLIVWSASIAMMLGLCILIYPEMGAEMKTMSKLFSNMGAFSAAFGMDKLNFGEFSGFFGIECGNVLGLGGAFFAALIGISALSKEEKEHTAEFLLTHPISRTRVLTEKLCAIFTQLVLLNLICILTTILCTMFIGEQPSVKPFILLFTAYFIMQLEIAGITFGLSAFLKHGSLGFGLGLAAMAYFMNILANLSPKAKFIKYFTPFGYTDGADLLSKEVIPAGYLSVGILTGIAGILAAYYWYSRKDIS